MTETFQEQLNDHYRATAKQDSLEKVRAKAWGQFLELGLPSRHQEVYRYVKLRNLFETSFVSSKPAEANIDQTGPYLLFVNGHLTQFKNIPARVVASPLNSAIGTYGAFLNNQWSKSIKEETDPFAVLNGAMSRDGVFIYLPPNCVVEEPIRIINIIDTQGEPMIMHPRVHLFVGACSEVTLVTTYKTISGDTYFMNVAYDATLEEGARLKYIQHNTPGAQKGWLFDALRVTMKRNSHLKTILTTKGSSTVRADYKISMMGENAEADLNGIWELDGTNEVHANVLIDHHAPHCRSMQLYKGVLNGNSRSSFEGKILVRQKAQKTDAFQLNNNLLLSDRANADSKPNLEIFADDVKASHGATMGQLDQEHLFYLKARGFSEEAAKKALIEAFSKEVLDQIPVNCHE